MIHTSQYEKGITVVRPGMERITAVNAADFKVETTALVDAGQSRLVIDFNDVTFLDSSGLGALIGILKRIGHQGEVVVCGLNDSLQHSFRITRMDRVFQSFANADIAVQALKERS